MWWLCAADGPLPVGEIIYGAGLVVLGCVIIDSVAETTDTLIEQFPSEENEASDNITSYREHTTTKNGKKRNKQRKETLAAREIRVVKKRNKNQSGHLVITSGGSWRKSENARNFTRLYQNPKSCKPIF